MCRCPDTIWLVTRLYRANCTTTRFLTTYILIFTKWSFLLPCRAHFSLVKWTVNVRKLWWIMQVWCQVFSSVQFIGDNSDWREAKHRRRCGKWQKIDSLRVKLRRSFPWVNNFFLRSRVIDFAKWLSSVFSFTSTKCCLYEQKRHDFGHYSSSYRVIESLPVTPAR